MKSSKNPSYISLNIYISELNQYLSPLTGARRVPYYFILRVVFYQKNGNTDYSNLLIKTFIYFELNSKCYDSLIINIEKSIIPYLNSTYGGIIY